MPAGGFRGYGLPQTNFAVESAIDEVAHLMGMDGLAIRRLNAIWQGDAMLSTGEVHDDVIYGSYGLDQCFDLMARAFDDGGDPASDGWLTGEGFALSLANTIPPGGHFSDSFITLKPDGAYELTVGTAEFGNGTTTVHRQIAASVLATAPANIHLRSSDTGHGGHDTGAFGSTGTVVAGRATERAARTLRDMILDAASKTLGVPRDDCALKGDAVTGGGKRVSLSDLHKASDDDFAATGSTNGIPRSVAFNVHGFRVAVNPVSGEIRILKSVQAADAGTVINPMQCRAQVEGGVAQAIGAALFEEMIIDDQGRVANAQFRNYHLPAFADVPRTEVLFAETHDTLGPFGAKSMSESPYNPVGAALANAVRDATGVRFHALPLKPDRVFAGLVETVKG